MNRHETQWALEELGKIPEPYKPTFNFSGTYIDEAHQSLSGCPLNDDGLTINWDPEITGWLQREDALKLYEMAYFSNGDILELGSYHGLSTSIISLANLKRSRRKTVYSVELDQECHKRTEQTLRRKGLQEGTRLINDDARKFVEEAAKKGGKYGFIFVDHSHAYEPVYEVCRFFDQIMKKDGFVLFHDYNDPANLDPEQPGMKVYQAVRDGLNQEAFELYGMYGCTALFKFKNTRRIFPRWLERQRKQ